MFENKEFYELLATIGWVSIVAALVVGIVLAFFLRCHPTVRSKDQHDHTQFDIGVNTMTIAPPPEGFRLTDDEFARIHLPLWGSTREGMSAADGDPFEHDEVGKK